MDRPQLVHKRSNHSSAHRVVTDQWEAPAHLAGASRFPLDGSHRWLHTNHDHNVGLANPLLHQLGMEPTDPALASLDLEPDFDRLRLDGLSVAYRTGRLRIGFHIYSTSEDVSRLVEVIKQ